MKLFLHIGTEKTGTSSIQDSLVRNSDLLNECGVHLLRACGDGNARALPAICMESDKFDDYFKGKKIETVEQKEKYFVYIVERMAKELSLLPKEISAVVISSEHFHSRLSTPEEVLRLKTILDPYFSDIEVICYIREQVAMCISHYSTAVKTGGHGTLSDFVRGRCTLENPYYNFNNFLSLWRGVFGKKAMNVRLFDRQFLADGDLLTDFFGIVSPASIANLDRERETSNASLTPTGQAIGRAINRNVPRFKIEGGWNSLHTELFKILDKEYSGSGEQLPDKEKFEKFDLFKTSNAKLKKEYFPERDSLFSKPKSVDEGKLRMPPSKLERVLTEILKQVCNTEKPGSD